MLLGSSGSVRPSRGPCKRFETPAPPEGLLPVPRGFARDPPGSHAGSFPAGAGQSGGSRRPRQCGGGWCRCRGPQRCVSSAAVGGESKAGPSLRRPEGAAGSPEPSGCAGLGRGSSHRDTAQLSASRPPPAPFSPQDPAMMSSLLPFTPTPSVPPPDTTSSTRPASPVCTVSPPAELGCRRGRGRGQGVSPAGFCLSRG